MDAISPARLSAFLVDAKRCTYAGLDDEATVSTPAFAGSKQLEYRDDGLSYRDIYFGMTYFVGQEVVQSGARVIWSMSYAGGLLPGIADRAEVAAIYAFLRQSLLRIEADTPFRGPLLFEAANFRYVNTPEGDVSEFSGVEHVTRSGAKVYGLRYSGGMIR
jgi:hypothetical protein